MKYHAFLFINPKGRLEASVGTSIELAFPLIGVFVELNYSFGNTASKTLYRLLTGLTRRKKLAGKGSIVIPVYASFSRNDLPVTKQDHSPQEFTSHWDMPIDFQKEWEPHGEIVRKFVGWDIIFRLK